MAVIREKRQFLSQPIGVVKAQVGNVEGARSLGQFADTLIEGSFKTLIEDAQQAGQEGGVSATSQQIRTINPETGQPEAFAVPPQFGRAASRAYQQVVERRYVTEVEQDLKTESAKIFAEEMLKPDGYANYSKRMRSYAEGITESALPRFENIVSGISSSLIASTEVDFIKRNAQRDLEDNLFALQEGGDANSLTLTNTGAVLDFSNEGQVEDFLGTFDGFIEAQKAGLTARVHSSETYSQQENNLVNGAGVGIARNIGSVYEQSLNTTNPLEPSDLVSLQQAIRTGVGADKLDPRLQKFVGIADRFTFQIGEEGKEVTRNYKGMINSSISTELDSIHSNAVRIKAAQKATATEQEQDSLYDWVGNMLNPDSQTGFNGLTQSLREKIDNGDILGAIAEFESNEQRIRKEGQKLNVPSETLENGIMRYRKGLSSGLLSVIYGSPIKTKDNKGREAMRPLLPSESNLVEVYLSGNKMSVTLQDLPKEIRPVVKQLESLQTNRSREEFNREVEGANQELQSFYEAKKKQAEIIQSGQTALSGGSLSTKKNRESVDAFTIGDNANTPLYFLTAEGYAQFDAFAPSMVVAGFVGQNLVDTYKVIAGGKQNLSETEINRAFDIWARLESRPDKVGGTFNVWSNSDLGKDTFDMMTSMSHVVKNLRGGQNAAQVYQTMRFNLDPDNREAFGDKMTFALGGKTVDSFIANKVGEGNFEAREYFEPLVGYFVAAGMAPDTIDETIDTMMDEHFVDTEGYVINSGSGEPFKSAFGLSKFMDKGGRIKAIANFNEFLAKSGANARISRKEKTLIEVLAFPIGGLLGTSMIDLEILDRGADSLQTGNEQEVYLTAIAGESTGTGEDVIYQLSVIENGTIQPYQHPKTSEFIYVNLKDLKKSVAPPQDYSGDDWLFMEYQRQQQIKQGTTSPVLESDMSTISLNPELSNSFLQFLESKSN